MIAQSATSESFEKAPEENHSSKERRIETQHQCTVDDVLSQEGRVRHEETKDVTQQADQVLAMDHGRDALLVRTRAEFRHDTFELVSPARRASH
jgi:hypothetical protein